MADNDYVKSSRPLYYGSAPTSGGPAYYGNGAYGNYGGAYGGGAYYYSGSNGQAGEDSMLGTITIGRVLRVIAQRWILVLVSLMIGLAAAFAVYRISPVIYEATSKFTMEMKRQNSKNTMFAQSMEGPDYGNTYEEVFNTRIAEWCSAKLVAQIIKQYHVENPQSTVTDEELLETLQKKTVLELERHSRLISVSVRNGSHKLAVDLANAYTKAIEKFSDEANKERCDAAVSQIQQQTDKQGRIVQQAQKTLLDYRMANKLDNMLATRETLKQGLVKTTADILQLESDETAADEWNKMLQQIQKDPDKFGNLPMNVPRAKEISESYQAYQKSQLEKNSLLARFTANHPEVKAKEKEADIYKQQFCDVVARAYSTAQGTVKALRNQLAETRAKRNKASSDLTVLDQKIVAAESGIDQLERTLKAESELYEQMRLKLAEARVNAEANNEVVRQVLWAELPRPPAVTNPVSPKPLVIFPLGALAGIAFGLFFVLALDHLEDTVIGIADIEGRLSLKVLAVLPHVRRKKREDVAKFVAEDKYSQFSEAVAGLRNLLDSPRYQMITQVVICISTQPGEGKTITSSSIAISHAQAGKKTLLVDFDLRRPRHARVWGLNVDETHSFSHVLNRGDSSNFAALVNKSGVENLDVIASLPPDGVNPASIMGSRVVPQFFEWARANYDRIVIDAPPFGVVGDVTTLASMVDSVLILCCPDRSRARPIQHATRHLTEAGATILGVVVNDVDMSGGSAFLPTSKSYGYGYGYGYGYKYGSAGGKKKSASGATKKPSPSAPDAAPAPVVASSADENTAPGKMDFADDD